MNPHEIFYPAGRRVSAWETAHTDGLVPDRWPYGLHQVRSPAGEPPFSTEADALDMRSLLKAMLGRRQTGGTHTSISWDEDTALRLFAQRHNTRKYAGVIWATDRVVRGELEFKDHILRRVLPRFQGLWVLSRAQLKVLEEWLGRNVPPIHFLRFGIDEEFFSPTPYPADPMVLSVGRDRDRDTRTLLQALEEVKHHRPDVDIAVQSLSTTPMPRGIRALPMMPHTELRNRYRAASVVAVATRPNVHVSGMTVALESMASARPIVISGTDGMSDYVADGATGLLVQPGHAHAMATAILRLLSDPERGAAIGRRGRAKVEREHRTATMAAEISKIVSSSDG